MEKAEAILLDIRRAIDNDAEEDDIKKKSDKFFEIIPIKQDMRNPSSGNRLLQGPRYLPSEWMNDHGGVSHDAWLDHLKLKSVTSLD